jgi:hypothetical protein
LKGVNIDAIIYNRDIFGRHSPLNQIAFYPLADNSYMVDLPTGPILYKLHKFISPGLLSVSAMVYCCVFPERAYFIDDWDTELSPCQESWKSVQDRGVSVQQVWLFLPSYFANASGKDGHHATLSHKRNSPS